MLCMVALYLIGGPLGRGDMKGLFTWQWRRSIIMNCSLKTQVAFPYRCICSALFIRLPRLTSLHMASAGLLQMHRSYWSNCSRVCHARKLHCTRNYIHMNLFVSFILRAVAVISKEIILYVMYSNLPRDDLGWNSYSSSAVWKITTLSWADTWEDSFSSSSTSYSTLPGDFQKQFGSAWTDLSPCVPQQMAFMCKFSKVCMEYFVACNYFWLLVEAIFLHTLLFTAVLTKRRLLKKYMLLGWGTWGIETFNRVYLFDQCEECNVSAAWKLFKC